MSYQHFKYNIIQNRTETLSLFPSSPKDCSFRLHLVPNLAILPVEKVKGTLHSPFTMKSTIKDGFFLCSVDSMCPLFENYKNLADNSTSSLLHLPSCHIYLHPASTMQLAKQWRPSDKASKGSKHHLELIIFLPCPKSLKGSSLHTELSSKFSRSNTSPLWF